MSSTRLQALLNDPLQYTPQKIAIRCDDSQITYAELDRRVAQLAAGLQVHGATTGDRVAWFLPNCLEAVLTKLACYRIGAVAVPLNYRYVAEELQDVIERTRAKLLVYHADQTETVQLALQSYLRQAAFVVGKSGDKIPPFGSLQDHGRVDESVAVEVRHPALILFTSGSTGRPKGVVHSHAGAFTGIDVSRRIFEFNSQDVVLVGKPISHAGGLQTQLMPTLLVGGEVILTMKPQPAKAVSLIRKFQVTEYGLLASDLLDFIEYLECNPTDLPHLQNAIGSGDSVPEDLHHRFRDLFDWEVMEGAGMTEIGGYYAANPRFGKRKWGSLGLPTPETELRIVDVSGTDCSDGQTGEIVLRTQSATTGYWEDEAATNELYRDGWLRTGDLGHFDEDQYIWFVGRKKLMIVRRGSNIAPAEVESIIDSHPLVHASVVVGVKDSRDGQIPVACVATRGLQKSESIEGALREFVAQHLAAYKNPAHYLFFDELPRTGTGKFDRQQLQAAAEQSFGPSNIC